MKRAASLIAALVVAGSAAAGGWRPLKIGGGGFLTGIDFSPDGTTRCVRTDTYGAYCYDAASGRWVAGGHLQFDAIERRDPGSR